MPEEKDWGLLLLDKPEGLTSHTATNKAARAMGFSRAGHAGTLDPLATGLMLVGLGRGTRLLEFLVGCDKTYIATLKFGVETETLDREGKLLREEEAPQFSPEELARTLARFTGTITQVPPMHSAIKVGGEALYKKARRGEEAEIPTREVTIRSINIVEWTHPFLKIEVECSSGTYIRSLARDIGIALSSCASLWDLRRTKCGPFDVDNAFTLEAVKTATILSPGEMVFDLPRVTLGESGIAALLHGRHYLIGGELPDSENLAVFDGEGNLAAICRAEGGVIAPRKVLLDQAQ